MDVLLGTTSSSAFLSSSSLIISNACRNPAFYMKLQPLNFQLLRPTVKTRFWGSLSCVNKIDYNKRFQRHTNFLQSIWRLKERYTLKLSKLSVRLHKVVKCSENGSGIFPVAFYRVAFRVIWVMTLSAAVTKTPSYAAIRKMIATLDDPFTRFLEPERFKNLQSGTKNALTGVGLSIGYPTENNGSPSGLVVVSASPGGPAYRAGISSGDIIVAIDDKSTENMGIYDAAECLQRERVLLNPVKSRICRTPGSGDKAPRVGYIKLTSFNQKASGAVKETIETLRRENVNAFVLDLRDNSGGLFPEGIEIAKICSCLKSLQFALKILGKRSQGSSCLLLPTRLDKGVIVYICDTRGVRDICDTAGSNAVAAAEPLAVLVNKGTASTSEILAGALKDNKRAVVFGESTYGKGKIQSVFKLSDGSGLAVTVARYETPAQTDIDKVGITPDCPLPSSFPKDDESFCGCIQDPAFACYLNRVGLFAGR